MDRSIHFPTYHPGQVDLFWLREDKRPDFAPNAGGRFRAARCGRRWGKTDFLKTWIGSSALKGHPNGWFAPGYKYISEVYEEFVDLLEPQIVHRSKTDGIIRLRGGGRIDFWTLEDDRAGRSRHYKRVAIDEGAFTKSNMISVWEQSIKPTLLDLTGSCIVASNTNGVDPENFLYALCNDPKHEFIEYHAPSWQNPFVPRRLDGEPYEDWLARQTAEYDNLRARSHPLVFKQEYAAEFVDWSGVAFFELDKLLVGGKPPVYPQRCDAVFGVVDSAVKTGSANDGTAVAWFAHTRAGIAPLYILDWDLIQIEGALLETWLPTVFQRGEELARLTGARAGFRGVFIEDKSSGEILLQQARRRNLLVHAIDSPLTAMGKDERAISVSGYVYNGQVKVAGPAYDKISVFKGTSRNHLISQVTGFRIGDKDAAKRADDLLDVFCYGIALALGNRQGF